MTAGSDRPPVAGLSGSFGDVFTRLADGDEDIRHLLEASLTSEWPIRWELPPLTGGDINRPYQHQVVSAPELTRRANPSAFAEHFRPGQSATAFANLSGDARLVAPSPAGGCDAAHLARFLATADDASRRAFWQSVGAEVLQHVADATAPRWVSTAGAGVPWLHLRIDTRPKYIGHEPYRDLAFWGRSHG